ncbi:MAG: ATP-dependent sacrificial sulfur transferase LarE [Thermomicrobiales bacterium]
MCAKFSSLFILAASRHGLLASAQWSALAAPGLTLPDASELILEGNRVNASPQALAKYEGMVASISAMRSAVVAFSGGVDSSLVLFAAHQALGDRAIAATGLSQTYAAEEIAEAKGVAADIGTEHAMVTTMELTDPRYADNTHQRCFFCKSELYTRLRALAEERGFAVVLDGANADDMADFRPGHRAAQELGVRSPLQEAGLTKSEIREVAAHFSLRTWDKPAAACLSSRFSYGDPITVEKLTRVAAAESALKRMGFKGFRVRHHGPVARLEFPPADLDRAFSERESILQQVKEAGYKYVAIDLEGYRAGSQNEVLGARLQTVGLRRSSTV